MDTLNFETLHGGAVAIEGTTSDQYEAVPAEAVNEDLQETVIDDVLNVQLEEPYGYPSLYEVNSLAKAAFADVLDLNLVMPGCRIGWLTNANNWSVLATNETVEDTAKNPGASAWFGACLAAVGGFFVSSPADHPIWDESIVVPTPYGDAIAKRCLLLHPGSSGSYNTQQYVFVKLDGNRSRDTDPVHEHMLKHLARAIGATNNAIHQVLSDSRIMAMLREGLNDPAIRWYANLPGYFAQLFMSKSMTQHRADSTYNASAWFGRVRYNNQVIHDAVTHYRLILTPELEEAEESVSDNELVARAMMLSVRARIMLSDEMRARYKK